LRAVFTRVASKYSHRVPKFYSMVDNVPCSMWFNCNFNIIAVRLQYYSQFDYKLLLHSFSIAQSVIWYCSTVAQLHSMYAQLQIQIFNSSYIRRSTTIPVLISVQLQFQYCSISCSISHLVLLFVVRRQFSIIQCCSTIISIPVLLAIRLQVIIAQFVVLLTFRSSCLQSIR